ncbi:hypothetical protein VaNZ11_007886 [Volvox africanus]|uniref:Pentacotripeptide-repeat region of PRORP domain-containing protein n=1 Tax=Volvox africanus TaxID=51714 RepID=A0ABQ5S4R8_9CHLO|nr:hypothetical protein VaNZ11_007886 [Volvox africanus]
MAGIGARTNMQVMQSPNSDACGLWRQPQIVQRLGSSIFRCSFRGKLTPTTSSVAAPERNSSVTSEVPDLLGDRQPCVIIPSTSLIHGSGDSTDQQVEMSTSPPSTSGRTHIVDGQHDRPFLPGSRRRMRNLSSRRNLSIASFYGEYCDMKATQRMVSTIWERLMSQGDSAGTAPASESVVSSDVGSSFQQNEGVVQESPASQQQQQLPAWALPGENGSSSGGGSAVNTASTIDRDFVPTTTPAIFPGATADGPNRSRRTTPALPLADGWSVASAVTTDGDVANAASSTPPRPQPPSPPHKRVVLYLGPDLELQLPPPSFGALPLVGATWSDTGGDPGSSSSVFSEQELRESLNAPKPRRVRGSRLSTSEAVRAVSFDGATATNTAGEQQGVRAPKPRRRKAMKTTMAATATANEAVQHVSKRQLTKGGKEVTDEEVQAHDRGCSPQAVAATAAEPSAITAAPGGSSSLGRQKAGRDPASTANRRRSERPSDSVAAMVTTAGSAPSPRRPEFSYVPQHAARQKDLLEALVERMSDAVVTERIQQLAKVNRAGVTALNFVIQALGEMGHVYALSRLLTLQVALGLYNEHTYGTAFRALHRAGRLGMALAAFQEACRSGRDLGPIACSVLLHIASLERNIKLAWQLFDQMIAHQMTLNRYAYNCMAHIASLHGALDDVRIIYGMMKAAASGNGGASSSASSSGGENDCRPDSYTYSAMVRAAVNAGRGDLLPALFNEMVASQRAEDRAVGRLRPLAPGEGEGRLSKEVWSHFISAACRTGQSELGQRFFNAGITELGLLPNREVYNVLLAGLAKTRPLPELLQLYGEMVQGRLRSGPPRASWAAGANAVHPVDGTAGPAAAAVEEDPPGSVRQAPLTPDHYTFNALLTAAAHHMADLPTLDRIRREMVVHGVGINLFIGTSLINAYRRTPELTRSGAATAASTAVDGVVAAAAAVMSELVRSGVASTMSYVCMTAFYATAQRPVEAVDCVRQMTERGFLADDSAWQFLMATAGDAGQSSLVRIFAAERQRQAAERLARQLQQQKERAERRIGSSCRSAADAVVPTKGIAVSFLN